MSPVAVLTTSLGLPRWSEMIAVGCTSPHHIVRHIEPTPVDKEADNGIACIQLGHGLQAVQVRNFCTQGAVDLLAKLPILPVHNVLNECAAGKGDALQVAKDIIVVKRCLAPCGLALQFAVGCISIGWWSPYWMRRSWSYVRCSAPARLSRLSLLS